MCWKHPILITQPASLTALLLAFNPSTGASQFFIWLGINRSVTYLTGRLWWCISLGWVITKSIIVPFLSAEWSTDTRLSIYACLCLCVFFYKQKKPSRLRMDSVKWAGLAQLPHGHAHRHSSLWWMLVSSVPVDLNNSHRPSSGRWKLVSPHAGADGPNNSGPETPVGWDRHELTLYRREWISVLVSNRRELPRFLLWLGAISLLMWSLYEINMFHMKP